MFYSIPPPSYPVSSLDIILSPSPVYVILLIGMLLFVATNVMQNLLPEADRVVSVAPMILYWGFALCLVALCTSRGQERELMSDRYADTWYVSRGPPSPHHVRPHDGSVSIVLPALEPRRSRLGPGPIFLLVLLLIKREGKGKAERGTETVLVERRERAQEADAMGRSACASERFSDDPTEPLDAVAVPPRSGREQGDGSVVGERNARPCVCHLGTRRVAVPLTGLAGHRGHFNKPDYEAEEAEEKKAKEKEKEREKAKEKEKAKAKAEEEAKAKAKAKEEEEQKKKDAEKAKIAAEENARSKAIEDRRVTLQNQKVWRTKYLAMIVGISLLNKTLGFLLLLFFSLQLVSQELNAKPIPPPSSSKSSSTSNSGSSSSEDKEKLAKMQAMKEREKEKASSSSSSSRPKESSSSSSSPSVKPKESSSSSSSSKPKESSSTSSSKESSSSSKPKEPSSSSSPKDPVTSEGIRKAGGSDTKTKVDSEDSHHAVPYKVRLSSLSGGLTFAQVGIGMHYIHTLDKLGELDHEANFIPSDVGQMAHPLMTARYAGYAN
ncbi:hypothetical protein P7C73_g3068, partial [Tremellales sp. Uapishka_1]